MIIEIHPKNPQERLIKKVVEILKKDGVIIYPTDTVYAIGCDIHSKKAIEKICRIKGVNPEKEHFACICESVSIVSEYAVQVSTPIYKLMKRVFPGPYTFILNASKNIPRHFQSKKKTIGIRVVDHQIPTAIVRELGNPILTSSLKSDDEFLEYMTDAEAIDEKFGHLVDCVIDGGACGLIPSTLVDCATDPDEWTIIREGLGDLNEVY